MRSVFGASLAIALAAAALGGCAVAPPPTVGVALPSDEGRWDEVAAVLTERLTAAGYAVDVRVADDDIPTQVAQLEQLLAAAPVALVVAPVDATSLTTVLDRAPDETEIVALGTLVRDTGAVDRLVAFDAGLEGFLQATALLQGLGLADDSGAPAAEAPPGPFRVELFAGSVDDERTEPSFAGAMSVLQPYLDAGTLVVGSGETALEQAMTLRGNGATAASRLTRLLHETYAASSDRAWPDAILSPSDVIARAAAEVLAATGAVAGEGFPVVTGRGAELRSVVAILDGLQYATLLEDPRLLASEAADRVIDALRAGPAGIPDPSAAPPGAAVDNGARQVPASLVQPQSVRSADIDALVLGSGYWTGAQLDDAVAEFGQVPSPTPSPTSTAPPA